MSQRLDYALLALRNYVRQECRLVSYSELDAMVANVVSEFERDKGLYQKSGEFELPGEHESDEDWVQDELPVDSESYISPVEVSEQKLGPITIINAKYDNRYQVPAEQAPTTPGASVSTTLDTKKSKQRIAYEW